MKYEVCSYFGHIYIHGVVNETCPMSIKAEFDEVDNGKNCRGVRLCILVVDIRQHLILNASDHET